MILVKWANQVHMDNTNGGEPPFHPPIPPSGKWWSTPLIFLIFFGCISSTNDLARVHYNQTNEFPGYNFSSVVELNTPLECVITYAYGGQPYESKVYMRGRYDMRVEVVGGSGLSQCTKTISIVRGDSVYVSCEKSILSGCDWFSSSYDQRHPGKSSTFDFTQTRASEISCRKWVFDPEKFSTEGRICNLG